MLRANCTLRQILLLSEDMEAGEKKRAAQAKRALWAALRAGRVRRPRRGADVAAEGCSPG